MRMIFLSSFHSVLALAFCVFVGFIDPATARLDGSLRGRRPLVGVTWKLATDVNNSLSEVLKAALDNKHHTPIEVRINRLEGILRPMYAALPKNPRGRLDHAVVRYALHRLFMHRHAMYIKGLEPGSATWNSSSATSILEDRVPAYVQSLFEERLKDGFDVHELAVLAATLEQIIHDEASGRLTTAYRLRGFSPDDNMTEAQLEETLDAYMVITLHGGNLSRYTPQNLTWYMKYAAKYLSNWPQTQVFMREVQKETLEGLDGAHPDGSWITLSVAMKIVESITERYGRWQDSDCQSMAKGLIDKEDTGTGRVKLSDFYQVGWQFSETKEYLQALGALDYSQQQQPRVIIPNYIMSSTNCFETSSLYSVCCLDHCQELLSNLEHSIAAPVATPEQIAQLVMTLPSATVQTPRHIPLPLMDRLQEIAMQHAGSVPLHGRLFAEWMNHAYPRECPYPQQSVTSTPLTPDEWIKGMGKPRTIPRDKVEQFIKEQQELEAQAAVKDLVDGDFDDTMPWIAEDELIANHSPPTLKHEFWVLIRAVVIICAVFSVTMSLVTLMSSAKGAPIDGNMKCKV